MKDGFVKVAAVTPQTKVADVAFNTKKIIERMREAAEQGAVLIVFPELCITGYSCGDLFLQDTLLREALYALKEIAAHTMDVNALVFVGLPYEHKGKLYNVAAALCRGNILGLVPKRYLPNYQEFYEARQFTPGMEMPEKTTLVSETEIYIGTRQLFSCRELQLCVGAEICEDLWTPQPPSIGHCLQGANVIVNLSASDEVTGKQDYRKELVTGQSARLYCGYVYASAGPGESTQDVVYSGQNLIAEAGHLLKSSELFTEKTIFSEIDVAYLNTRRRNMNTFEIRTDMGYRNREFCLDIHRTTLTRRIDKAPFVPENPKNLLQRCEEILNIQSVGLKKRLAHTGCKTVTLGISGGLDSALALLVTVRAFDMLSLDRRGIIAVTMPGFGTTDRTYENAVTLIRELSVTFREISIKHAVEQHFVDIGHDAAIHDVTYENSQARERTQILMDIANQTGGFVIGTGDMSELALGWATYNGDHMSMYGVNVSIPKTLVRHLVRYYADTCGNERLTKVLYDVLDTPVSPELLPPKDGKIAQKTEELVGPYELHDFFLYYLMRYACSPEKIYRLACRAFADEYDAAVILHWEKIFYRRFFSQQFKRSCLPDGPKVGTVSLSPRGDWRMPSDACAGMWLKEMETLEKQQKNHGDMD